MPLNRKATCKKDSYLSPQKCCAPAVAALDQHLTIPIRGSLTTQTKMFQTLVGMATMNQSIHSISGLLKGVSCETSLRHHLDKIDMDTLKRMNGAILAHPLKHLLKPGEAYQCAIDYTHDPYYGGTTEENESFIIRSQKKQSTHDSYTYVTLYVTTKHHQVTLAVYPVCQGVTKVEYIGLCLDQIAELGLEIEVLCLDREFYSGEVFAFLNQKQVRYIVPVKRHGDQMKEILKGEKSRYAEYPLGGKKPLLLTIAIKVTYLKGKRGKRGIENLGYVVGNLAWDPNRVHQAYRSRFAIESSYRMRNQVKPRTSTRKPTLRYLYAIIAFLIKNVWVALLWKYFSPVKPGPRTIETCAFTFQHCIDIIAEAIRKAMARLKEIPVLRSPG